jgi:hypothetical protein
LNTISTFAFSDASAETTVESIWSAFGVSAPTERSLIYDMLTGVAPDSGAENQDGDRDGVNDAADLCSFTNEGELPGLWRHRVRLNVEFLPPTV